MTERPPNSPSIASARGDLGVEQFKRELQIPAAVSGPTPVALAEAETVAEIDEEPHE